MKIWISILINKQCRQRWIFTHFSQPSLLLLFSFLRYCFNEVFLEIILLFWILCFWIYFNFVFFLRINIKFILQKSILHTFRFWIYRSEIFIFNLRVMNLGIQLQFLDKLLRTYSCFILIYLIFALSSSKPIYYLLIIII